MHANSSKVSLTIMCRQVKPTTLIIGSSGLVGMGIIKYLSKQAGKRLRIIAGTRNPNALSKELREENITEGVEVAHFDMSQDFDK